jgi:SAM-dependent methyltransferase
MAASFAVSEGDAGILNREVPVCPACGSSDYAGQETHGSGFSVIVSNKTFKQPSYVVRECLNCGLLYRSRTLLPPDLERYYARVDFRKWETSDCYPTEARVLSMLRTLSQGSRILDYGCSSGRLLSTLCSEYECFGFEVNSDAAAQAARKGLRMLTHAEIEDSVAFKFDAIVMVDVFEHLLEPLQLLRQLVRLLNDNGKLIIATGNGDAAACRRNPALFWYFRTAEHLIMLTRRHANFLASVLGMRLQKWEELCHYKLRLGEKLFQRMRHFAYWQFYDQTFLAKMILGLVPYARRARHWPCPPAYTCSKDHVVALFVR